MDTNSKPAWGHKKSLSKYTSEQWKVFAQNEKKNGANTFHLLFNIIPCKNALYIDYNYYLDLVP